MGLGRTVLVVVMIWTATVAYSQVGNPLLPGGTNASSPAGMPTPAPIAASVAASPVVAATPTVSTTASSAGTTASGPLFDVPKAVPETVRLDRTGTAAPVLFLHQLHESRQSCKDCHGGRQPLFPKSHSPQGYTMAEMQKGKFCGKCHDGVTAYDVRTRCDLCHYSPGRTR